MKSWGQCLFYALDQWHQVGGRPCFRKSEHWPIAHVEHTNDQSELTHFVPTAGKLKTSAHALIGFWGEVLHHDFAPCRPMPVWGIVASCWLAAIGSVLWAIKTIVCKMFKLRPYP